MTSMEKESFIENAFKLTFRLHFDDFSLGKIFGLVTWTALFLSRLPLIEF
jgi:hypothetical protein